MHGTKLLRGDDMKGFLRVDLLKMTESPRYGKEVRGLKTDLNGGRAVGYSGFLYSDRELFFE